ncbi:hypothetical protein [Paraburkholderia fynbosensis]|uniref:Uncharacterized protein n=1 Tax=Paraburkholderia fynbosensis TaxID=1200993 RepID=A0A6J5H5E5_9BURK|nr:hypothetical protein [Paraburkholderia fynbosensis]CAB3810796.1 hypothetical protein LMG27177_07473 [Paraburkholderia fynbosensis]
MTVQGGELATEPTPPTLFMLQGESLAQFGHEPPLSSVWRTTLIVDERSFCRAPFVFLNIPDHMLGVVAPAGNSLALYPNGQMGQAK